MGAGIKPDKVSSSECSDSGSANDRLAPKARKPNVQAKATEPARTLPNWPGRNVHPAGPPIIRRKKEQIKADCEAELKALEEKIQAIQMAKEQLAQMNIMEEDEEDDLPGRHPEQLSTTIQKWRHMDMESDSDESFDLREVVDDSCDLDSSSESNNGTQTKKVNTQYRWYSWLTPPTISG